MTAFHRHRRGAPSTIPDVARPERQSDYGGLASQDALWTPTAVPHAKYGAAVMARRGTASAFVGRRTRSVPGCAGHITTSSPTTEQKVRSVRQARKLPPGSSAPAATPLDIAGQP